MIPIEKIYKSIETMEKDIPLNEQIQPLWNLINQHNNIMGRLVRLHDPELFASDLSKLKKIRKQINSWCKSNLKEE